MLSRAPWARSSSWPSTLLKKLFMVTASDLQQGQDQGQSEPDEPMRSTQESARVTVWEGASCHMPWRLPIWSPLDRLEKTVSPV